MESHHPELEHCFALARAGRGEEALALISRIAAAGDAEALFVLADMHWRGSLVRQDFAQARRLFARASDAGHGIAALVTTNLLANGYAGGRDWPAALARLRHEAAHDARRAQILACVEAMALDAAGDPAAMLRSEPLSQSPQVVRFPAFLSAAECALLCDVAEPIFAPATTYDPVKGDMPDPVRTSDGAMLHSLIEDPAVHAINRRIAAASGTGAEQGELLLVQRYRPGQQYRRHFDALPGLANQRQWTMLVYLSDGYRGGETEFVRAGLRFRGDPGDAILFRNTGPDGRADPMSEHAGLPVTEGRKYLATRWIRAEPIDARG